MSVISNSLILGPVLRLWLALVDIYRHSVLARLLAGLSVWWTKCFAGSGIMHFFIREGRVPHAWGTSRTHRVLSVVVNFPLALLNLGYIKGKKMFDSSFFAQLGFGLGESVPSMIGWVLVAVLIVPYKQWNNMYSLAGFAFCGVLMLMGGMRRRSLRVELKSVGPYAVFFAAAVFLAWPLSYSSALSMRFLFFHVTCMLCVGITVSSTERPEQLRRLVGAAGLALVGVSFFGLYQKMQGVAVNMSYVDMALNEGMPGRIFSVFENPNAFAEVLVMLIPLAVALFMASRSNWVKLGAACAVGLGTVCIGMTYGRASWVGLAVAALVFVFLWRRRLLPLLLAACIIVIPLLPETIFNRILTIFNPDDTSTSSRFPLYEAALRLLAQRPVQGAGLGTDAVRAAVADLSLYHQTAPFVHAHNIYLQVWLEMGLVGILAFVATMFSGLKSAAKAVKSPNCPPDVRLVTIGAASALVGILVNGLADYIWTYPRVMVVFWFVFAVMLAGIKLAKKGHRVVTA